MKIFEVVSRNQISKLYHYSEELYDDLRTKAKQGEPPKKGQDPDYNKHISFFFEPVPLDILGSIYKKSFNDFWYTGHKIYEYTILIKDLPKFKYKIVESPMHNFLFYDDSFKDIPDKEWDEIHDHCLKQLGEVGNNKNEFIEVATRMLGLSRQQYIDLPSRPNWNKIKDMYGPTVPHVMLYPAGGIVNYHSVKQVEVKNNPIKKR